MRLVHLSDLHLGFRQYQRLTPAGINQREADVARSFQRAVDMTIALRPDLVLVAGDVFHNVRPTNPAILHAFHQFARLTRELPEAIVVVVAGNHDTPRALETGCILRLFSPLGVQVVDMEPQRLAFPERELSILCVPDIPGNRPALVPDPDVKHNILLLHGEVEGMLPAHAQSVDRAALEIPLEELGAARWSYVALGHYHVYRQVAPNAFYSGSIDYTSANAWGELYEQKEAGLEGKGIIEHDLVTGYHRFHPLAPSRVLADLPPVSAKGLTTDEVDAAVRHAVESFPGGIEDKVVRLIVRDIPRHVARELDHKALREYRKRALHFYLDTRKPEAVPRTGDGAPGRRPSLLEIVREQLQARPLPADLDRARLVSLGLEYLAQAEQGASIPSAAALE
ncbi:MAG: Calcineurin-like phosphoesterase superfamily domain protein [Gemmatimonadetes bacterium]|nr:Calcineurin-like phosphoesterase superfamily domain protein [Gemmatimonadota bacterium]